MKYFSDLSINRRRFLNATGASAVLALSGLPMRDAYAQAQTGTLVIGHTTVRHLNPAIQSGQATGVPGVQLFAGLLQMDDKFQPHPYLAKSWTVSDDGLVYSFKLVEGAVFHDGKPITSEDVAFSLDIVKANHPFGSSMFKAVGKVETPDAHTVILRLDYPQPALPAALSPLLLPILPKHVYSTAPIQGHPANTAVVGSGPFKLVEFTPGQRVVMERFDKFFRKGRPYLDRIVFTILKDRGAQAVALSRGDIQYAPFPPLGVSDIMRLKKDPKLVVTDKGSDGIGWINWLEFNLRKPPFNDVRVRQAISYAIDRKFIREKLQQGLSKPATGPIASSSPYFDKSLNPYNLDLAKANKLLDEAGYKRKADGMRFSARLDWIPIFPDYYQTVAEYLRPQLKKIGIDIQLRPSPDFSTWAQRVPNWDFDINIGSSYNYADPVIGVHRTYVSSNIRKGVPYSNVAGYSNPKVDEILAAASGETDQAKRTQLYHEFQKIINQEVPVAILYEVPVMSIYSRDLANVPMGIWGWIAPFDEVYFTKKPQ